MVLHQRRISTMGILLVTLIGLGLLDTAPALPNVRDMSHDIMGAIKSLIYSYNELDNKLERHEHRERALGELMKKAMQSLQKGQKNLEPIVGTFSRLDERVSQIETTLLMQEDKYSRQREKIDDALATIYNFMRENNECMKRPPVGAEGLAAMMQPPPAPVPVAPVKDVLSEEFMLKQDTINKELMSQLQALTAGVQSLIEISQHNMDPPKEITETLTNVVDKLVHYSVVTPAPIIEPVSNKEFEDIVLVKFEELSTGISELKALPKTQEGLLPEDKEYIQGLANDTLNALQLVKNDLIVASDKALEKTSAELISNKASVESNFEKLLENVQNSSIVLNNFYDHMRTTYGKLDDALEVFNKFNNILMANSEHVLETQRKVEYGSFQIIHKLGDLIEKQNNDLADLLKERFNSIDEAMLTNKIEAMKNLSEIIEAEIGQVWRRIEIMGDEITTNTELLKMFNARNEIYVNTTLGSMDTMSTTFKKIDDRVLELTENLNFLLGKLGIISLEFRNIKTGLSTSLEELRDAFKSVQDEVPKGSGPHYISNNGYETHLNQLNKRQAVPRGFTN